MYTNKEMKLLRKKKNSIHLTPYLQKVIRLVEPILEASFKKEKFLSLRGIMYNYTRYLQYQAAYTSFYPVIEEAFKNIDDIVPFISNKQLNDVDKYHLIKLYSELLKQSHLIFLDVVQKFSELRNEEIYEKSEKYESLLRKILPSPMFSPSDIILTKAIEASVEDTIETINNPILNIDSETINRSIAFIEEKMKKDKELEKKLAKKKKK